MTDPVAANAGVYLLVLRLDRPAVVQVGRLGRVRFEAGLYAYAGSAQRGLASRIARHRRREKKARWHIDYLTRRATVERAWAWPLPKSAECLLAGLLASGSEAERVAPGFGASDCRCGGHLARIRPGVDLERVRRILGTPSVEA